MNMLASVLVILAVITLKALAAWWFIQSQRPGRRPWPF